MTKIVNVFIKNTKRHDSKNCNEFKNEIVVIRKLKAYHDQLDITNSTHHVLYYCYLDITKLAEKGLLIV